MAVADGKPGTTLKDITRTDDTREGRAAGETPGGADVRPTKLFKQVAPYVATKQAFLRLGDDPAMMELVMVRTDGAAEVYPISIGLRAHFLNVISQAMNHEAAKMWRGGK